jgi:type I restriction enzyme S subunit
MSKTNAPLHVPVGEYLEKVKTCSPATVFKEALFDYLDISSVDRDSKTITGATKTRGVEAPSRARQVVQAGDVLVSTVRPNLNAVAQVGDEYHNAVASTGFCVLRPKKGVLHSNYLLHWVKSPAFINDMVARATGANYPAVSDKTVKTSLIPLSSFEEQQRIADTLDAADALRRKDQELLGKYDELAQSIFHEMFGDPARNDRQWPSVKLGDVTSHVSSGSTPLGGERSYTTEGITFIRSQNVLMRRMKLTDVSFIQEEVHRKMSRTWVKKNDVLLNITGASIGRVAMFEGESDTANVNQHVCIIRSKVEHILPEFLMFVLAFESFQNLIIGSSAGGTREAFTFNQIRAFNIILPSLKLQAEFLTRLDLLRSQVTMHEKVRNSSAQMFDSLLARYFA